ncbi:MAG TPA: helix-turn-helix domain-containing protein [Candidatus Dormibacteraeota bacterium]|nr:helix-turn-helix domain-containing protein [Candidatus Dormibacteraeota bacterium]
MSFEKRSRRARTSESTAAPAVHDPRVMRALAHPRRLELLRRLRAEGPATATMLGEATRQSPASASYHLRQLGAHGLVEEVPDRGVGRERWWRAGQRGTRIEAGAFLAPATRTPAIAVAAASLRDGTDVALAFLDAAERGEVEEAWLAASLLDDTGIHATAEELRDIGRRMAEIVAPYVRQDKSARPAGARQCHVSIRTLPVV